MTKHQRNTAKVKNTKIVWAIFILFLIMVFATAGVVATIMSKYLNEAPNVIALSPDKAETVETPIFKTIYRKVQTTPDIAMQDEVAKWETQTTVDLFKSTYMNEKGEITVQSTDGSKIIAPGTSSKYDFSIKNTGNVVLFYEINLKGIFKVSNNAIPFKLRVYKNGAFVLGSDDEWCDVVDIESFTDASYISVGDAITYTLEWEWPFDPDNADLIFQFDEIDTEIGNISSDVENRFELDIQTISEEVPGAVAVDENGNLLYEEILDVKDIISVALMSGLGLVALGCLIFIIVVMGKGILFSGFLRNAEGHTITYKRKKTSTLANGRFYFDFVRFGKVTLLETDSNGNKVGTLSFTLKRKKKVEGGILFSKTEDVLVITLDKRICVVELFLVPMATGEYTVSTTGWALFDKNNTLFTKDKTVDADMDGNNKTPYGMTINKKHKVSFSL